MRSFDIPTSFTGVHVARGDPDWSVLSRLCDADQLVLDQFMWMGSIHLDDDRLVQAYKHVETRCYLHLAGDLSAFRYRGYGEDDRYCAVPLGVALREVFCLCRELGCPEEAELRASEALIDRYSLYPRRDA